MRKHNKNKTRMLEYIYTVMFILLTYYINIIFILYYIIFFTLL